MGSPPMATTCRPVGTLTHPRRYSHRLITRGKTDRPIQFAMSQRRQASLRFRDLFTFLKRCMISTSRSKHSAKPLTPKPLSPNTGRGEQGHGRIAHGLTSRKVAWASRPRTHERDSGMGVSPMDALRHWHFSWYTRSTSGRRS